jgi:ATP-binding cassette subfamily F protein 3
MAAFDGVRLLEQELADSAHALQEASPEEHALAAARYASFLERYETLAGQDPENAVQRAAAGLGLNARALATPAAAASGGERTRAALARALLAQPDILLLDEPTNHLDLSGLAWLDRYLAGYPGAFVVVSHDRYFLDKVVTQVWELERGRLRAYPGNYSKYRILKAEWELRQQREYSKQQTFIAKEEAFIQRYRAGQRAREARGRAKKLARLDRVDTPQHEATVAMPTIAASHTAQVVLSTRGLKVGVETEDGTRTLLAVPDLRVERGERIGIIGENGAGKTTLLRTLLGQTEPLAGAADLGSGVNIGYYRQGLDDLPVNLTVLEAFFQAAEMPTSDARNYLARFLFRGDDVDRRVGDCSGGERARLALARLLISQPNMLVMDEPTNHLDIPSREALEDVLQSYNGTLVCVSHDRRFLSLLADELWVARNGQVEVFRGTFEEWEEAEDEAARQREAAGKTTRASRPVRTPPPARPAVREARPAPKPPRVDHEKRINELEAAVQSLERDLQQAAEQNAFARLSDLSRQHAEAQKALEQAWSEWASAST